MLTEEPQRGPGLAREAGALLASLALCYAVAWAGSALTAPGLGPWYEALKKPAWTPPGKAIALVWSLLFTLMGFAAWRVLRRDRSEPAVRAALAWHGGHLLLNAGWSACFFFLRTPALALADIALLIAAIAFTIRAFARLSRLAAWLMAPYLAWVCFAAILNAAIVWMNL